MTKAGVVGKLVVRSLAVIAFVSWCDRALAEERIDSRYTSTARAKALSFRDESNIPEGGFEAVFAGLGGYQLVHLAGDERSWINIRFGKKTVDLPPRTLRPGNQEKPYAPGRDQAGQRTLGSDWPCRGTK